MKITRREFVHAAGRGALFTAAMAPYLTARAAPIFPKRLLCFLVPEGTIPEQFFPGGGETNFALPRILAPLAAYKERMVVFKGVENNLFVDHGGGGSVLTGVWRDGPEPAARSAESSGGMSIDQYLAGKIGQTRVRSYNSVVLPRYRNDSWSRNSAGVAVPGQESPYKALQDLLVAGSSTTGTTTTVPPEQRRRISILANAKAEVATLNQRLGNEEKQKLDMHMSAIADLERQFGVGQPTQATPTTPAADCKGLSFTKTLETSGTKITDLGNSDPSAWNIYPDIGRMHMEVLVRAFACDQTRVATLLWAGTNNWTKFPFLGINAWYHTLAHSAYNAEGNENMAKVQEFHVKQLVWLLDKMSSIPEGDGTLLDNTLILWTSEMGHGNSHSHKNIPFMLIGNAGSAMKTGRALNFPTPIPHNNVLTSVCNAMGAPIAKFGAASVCTGPVAGLGV